MEKFLSIPVTNEQFQIVSATDIKLIEQASTTTVTITYGGGKVVTITHATAGAGVEAINEVIKQGRLSALDRYKTTFSNLRHGALPASDDDDRQL
jgi:hypothetical protein